MVMITPTRMGERLVRIAEVDMPARLRDQHLRQVLKAVIRYSLSEGRMSLSSERDDGGLVITLRLADADRYHECFAEVMDVEEPESALPDQA